MQKDRIAALIPAAGLSGRMGDFKPLLPLRGKTVIENCVESVLAAGAETVTVVTGYNAEAIEKVLKDSFGSRVSFVRNEDYRDTDMMCSVRIGLSAMPSCDAFFLVPGDMPVISGDTYARLVEARMGSSAMVFIPVLDGKQTHPPLIVSEMIPEILSFKEEGGLRELWKLHNDKICYVPVTDTGTAIDLDTPTDYKECREIFE